MGHLPSPHHLQAEIAADIGVMHPSAPEPWLVGSRGQDRYYWWHSITKGHPVPLIFVFWWSLVELEACQANISWISCVLWVSVRLLRRNVTHLGRVVLA